MRDPNFRSREVQLDDKPVRRPPEKLPWPRRAEDGTELGVDVVAKRQDIVKIVYKHFKVPEISMDELLQEVFLAIVHKNRGNSAHDPRKSSFGHYVYMVANNVCINLVQRKKRSELERDSLDAPIGHEGRRSVLDTVAAAATAEEARAVDPFESRLDDIEAELRRRGLWDVARYVRAVRTGASALVIREALSWRGNKVTTKVIRDMRAAAKETAVSLEEG